MATTRRADTMSAAQLSKSISKAIDLAAKRHSAVLDKENLVYNWEILGRVLREMDLSRGQTRLDVATTVVKNLPAGFKAQPVVTKIGKDVLVGFIDRSNRTLTF
jgi:hypothetical protein